MRSQRTMSIFKHGLTAQHWTLDTKTSSTKPFSNPCFLWFPLAAVFHYVPFCPEGSITMHYCNHTGYVGCRLCLLCIVCLWTGLMALHGTEQADTLNGFCCNNSLCSAVLPVTSVFSFYGSVWKSDWFVLTRHPTPIDPTPQGLSAFPSPSQC